MKIKGVETTRYTVELWDTTMGFQVFYLVGEKTENSEIVKDYHTADFLFDMKLLELEGN